MKRTLTLLGVAAIFAAALSCTDNTLPEENGNNDGGNDGGTETVTGISLDRTEWNAPAKGELTVNVTVTTSMDTWTARTGSASWLTAETTDTGLTVTADENTSSETRTATVTVTGYLDGDTAEATLAVTQDAAVHLNVSAESLSFTIDGGTATFAAESNYDISRSLEGTTGWFTLETSGGTYTVTASENASAETGREGTIVLTAGDGAENTAEIRIPVTQESERAPMILVYTNHPTELCLPLGGNVSGTVDWGDGSDPETVTDEYPSHAYSSTSSHAVTFTGTATEIHAYSSDSGESCRRLTELVQWGSLGRVTDMSYAFAYTKITTVPVPPADLLSECSDFSYVFYNCTSLTSVPAGLFKGCESAETYALAFSGSALAEIPAGLFDDSPDVTDFTDAFEATAIRTVPEGLFARNTKVTTFTGVVSYCTSLTSVPEDMFASCPDVTTFFGLFWGDTALKNIPSGIFDNNRKVTNFNDTFSGCSAAETESPYTEIDVDGQTVRVHLYERENYPDHFTAPANHDKCFNACTKLSDYYSIPSTWKL